MTNKYYNADWTKIQRSFTSWYVNTYLVQCLYIFSYISSYMMPQSDPIDIKLTFRSIFFSIFFNHVFEWFISILYKKSTMYIYVILLCCNSFHYFNLFLVGILAHFFIFSACMHTHVCRSTKKLQKKTFDKTIEQKFQFSYFST